jgi:hypothetical protein
MPGGRSEKEVSSSLVGKGETWGEKGSSKMWERGSFSKVKRCGRWDPCTLRTDINSDMLNMLTEYAARASIKESLKPLRPDSEAIPVCSNVVIVEDT